MQMTRLFLPCLLALSILGPACLAQQLPDQKALQEAMARGCKSALDEIEQSRKLIAAQADEIKAGQQALKDEQAASAAKTAQLQKQDELLKQKDETIKQTSLALEAQRKATDTAVGALNVERAKNGLLKKVVAGGAVIVIIAIAAVAH